MQKRRSHPRRREHVPPMAKQTSSIVEEPVRIFQMVRYRIHFSHYLGRSSRLYRDNMKTRASTID